MHSITMHDAREDAPAAGAQLVHYRPACAQVLGNIATTGLETGRSTPGDKQSSFCLRPTAAADFDCSKGRNSWRLLSNRGETCLHSSGGSNSSSSPASKLKPQGQSRAVKDGSRHRTKCCPLCERTPALTGGSCTWCTWTSCGAASSAALSLTGCQSTRAATSQCTASTSLRSGARQVPARVCAA